MALVDVLDWMPQNHPQRPALIKIMKSVAPPIAKYQDAKTGLWWQVMDQGARKGNFTESSASCMFVYALAKGVRMGYLPQTYEANVRKGWQGIQTAFVKTAPDGSLQLDGTVKVGGLGMAMLIERI